MKDAKLSRLDVLLDLLADEVARKLEERSDLTGPRPELLPPDASISPILTATFALEEEPEFGSESSREANPEPALDPTPELIRELEPRSVAPGPFHAAALMARLAIAILLAVVLINIPLNAQGTALARVIPSSASLVIRNGLIVKEATSPEFWVYRDGAFHWITSLEAFEHFGYRWQDVRVVEQGFLSHFERGSPLYVLLKCGNSPDIYRFERGSKRWIVDIPTFEAEAHEWKDVKSVSCEYLRSLPDGESIPPGHGSPPSASP